MDPAVRRGFAPPRRLAAFCIMVGMIAAAYARASDSPDVVIADFEGDAYGGWIADGDAFGTGPARGTFPGQMAVSGFLGRGLVNVFVDQIVQSARSRGIEPARRELVAGSRYLLLPVQQDAPPRRIRVRAGERVVREFDIKLAESKPQFEVFLDVQPFQGQTLALEALLPAGSEALKRVSLSAQIPDARRLYHEPRRPQFHFTSRRGWLNDPNGLLWHDGEYHMFYQHNPYGWDWGNMHWGHAVSRDLVHWTELPIALYPKEYGDWCFSGSGVVDSRNASGFGSKASPALIVAFTSTGRGECIAYSNDRGRTWTEYGGNPVVKHSGRDPRLLWHEPTNRWVMAVYDETSGARAIALHSSQDLKKWTYESRVDGFFECPELFELPVDGEPGRTLWVLHGADGEYRLGRFDGHRFEPETSKDRLWYGNFYASQTISDAPDHRRIQIGWANGITFPGESFNQQMTVPCDLTLRRTKDGVRLYARPVEELGSLRRRERVLEGMMLGPGEHELAAPEGDLLEINVDAEVDDGGIFTLFVRGTPIMFSAIKKTLVCGDTSAPLAAEDSLVRLRVLLDRGSIEVFGNDGRVAISRASAADGAKPRLSLTVPAESPPVKLRSCRIYELASAWQ